MLPKPEERKRRPVTGMIRIQNWFKEIKRPALTK